MPSSTDEKPLPLLPLQPVQPGGEPPHNPPSPNKHSDARGSLAPHSTDISLPRRTRDVKRIIVMGLTGAGKSTFINHAASSDLPVSDGLVSCTQTPTSAAISYPDGLTVELLDTPGFNDSERTEIEVLEEISRTLCEWNAAKKELHAVIYLHRISDSRLAGSARRCFNIFMNICGNKAMGHVAIITNMWDKVTPELGEAREAELMTNPMFFKRAIDQRAISFRNDGRSSLGEFLRYLVSHGPVRLTLQDELARGIPPIHTTAGVEIDVEMARRRAEHEIEISRLNKEYKAAQQQHDADAQEEIEFERASRKKELEKLQRVAESLQGQVARKAAEGRTLPGSHHPGARRGSEQLARGHRQDHVWQKVDRAPPETQSSSWPGLSRRTSPRLMVVVINRGREFFYFGRGFLAPPSNR